MSKKYTVTYFIKKFSAIPARRWTTYTFHDKETGRRCALGHCRGNNRQFLNNLFQSVNLFVSDVNDDSFDPQFKQKTPRGRILAALRFIKAKSC